MRVEEKASNQTSNMSYDIHHTIWYITSGIISTVFTYVREERQKKIAAHSFCDFSRDWVGEFQFMCRSFFFLFAHSHPREHVTALEFWILSYRSTHTYTCRQNENIPTKKYLSFCHFVTYKWINLNYSHFADTIAHSYKLIAQSHRIASI